MHFSRAISHLFVSAFAVSAVVAVPTSPTLESREDLTVYKGYCSIDENSCMWSDDSGNGPVGTCTCSTGSECGVTDGRCYYDNETLQCICPTGK